MKKILVLCTSLLLLQHTFAQSSWELKKDKDGIKVYTRDADSSDFKEIKVEALLTGTLEKLVAILQDIDHHKDWVFKTKTAYLLKKINGHELMYYAETSVPIFSNRDIPIHMTINYDSNRGSLYVKTVGEPRYIGEKSDIVRIKKFYADYVVKKVSPNKISIVYFLAVDPGGTLSSSISNMFVSKGPFETFEALAKLLNR